MSDIKAVVKGVVLMFLYNLNTALGLNEVIKNPHFKRATPF